MDEKRFRRVAKAMADPRRFEILRARAISRSGETSCGAIAELFPIGQSTVSHHLKLLEDADLVSVRRQGQHGFFSARPDVLEQYIKELEARLIIPDTKRSD